MSVIATALPGGLEQHYVTLVYNLLFGMRHIPTTRAGA